MSKERYLYLTLKKIQENGRELKRQYIKEWRHILGNFRRVPEMYKREVFIQDIARRVNNLDPVLVVMLRADFLRDLSGGDLKPPEVGDTFLEDGETFYPVNKGLRLIPPWLKLFRVG